MTIKLCNLQRLQLVMLAVTLLYRRSASAGETAVIAGM